MLFFIFASAVSDRPVGAKFTRKLLPGLKGYYCPSRSFGKQTEVDTPSYSRFFNVVVAGA